MNSCELKCFCFRIAQVTILGFCVTASFASNFATENTCAESANLLLQKPLKFREEPRGDGLKIILSNSENPYLGSLSYQLFPSGNELQVNVISIASSLRGQGLSKQLFAYLLKKHPETKTIRAFLTMDNYGFYEKALYEGRDRIAAVEETPLYRALSRHGFRSVSFLNETSQQGKGVWIQLHRPTPSPQTP